MKKEAHKDSKTGERFVSPTATGARLDYRHEGHTYYLGSYPTLAEAVDCREAVREELEFTKDGAALLRELTTNNRKYTRAGDCSPA